jgi:hypothetical protein
MCKVTNIDKINVINISNVDSIEDYILEKYDNNQEGFHSIKIETMEQLKVLINSIYNDSLKIPFIFRGQRNSNWKITSTLEREITSVFTPTSEDYNKIAKAHLANVKKLIRGKANVQFLLLNDSPENDEELWAIGQHYNLKTPLVDWTKSFFNALFFAFHKQKNDTSYRAVYRLAYNFQNIDKEHKYIYEPKIDYYGRITAQQGLFTYWGIDFHLKTLKEKLFNIPQIKSEEDKNAITSIMIRKYYISENLRDEILKLLNFYGVTEENIYPDLDGIINKANNDLEKIIISSLPNNPQG